MTKTEARKIAWSIVASECKNARESELIQSIGVSEKDRDKVAAELERIEETANSRAGDVNALELNIRFGQSPNDRRK
jgi:hypothetical protein